MKNNRLTNPLFSLTCVLFVTLFSACGDDGNDFPTCTFDDAATKFTVSDCLPANRSYFTYGGSLTTPPCSETVTWLVMENPVEASAEQVKAFHELEHDNARPVQARNGRALRHFHI